jgi:hypothetical protein
LDLGAGTLKVTVVIQKLQTSDKLLRAATHEGDDLIGTEKTMPVDEPDDLMVAFRQLNGCNRQNALKAGKPWGHFVTMTEIGRTK